jgi:hypothetical protein
MRTLLYVVAISCTLSLGACGRVHENSESRKKEERDRNSASFKAGEIAHGLSKEVGKAANAAGREIGKDAREAHDGWKQAQRDEREKKTTSGSKAPSKEEGFSDLLWGHARFTRTA